MTKPNLTQAERFWMKVDKSGNCWMWTASKYSSGYGAFNRGVNLGTKVAHRVAWELINGPIPEGKFLDHQCFNRACVNPNHLRIVTNKQNGENRAPKEGGRGVSWRPERHAWRVRVTHNYHEYFGGYFSNKAEALEAAKALRSELFTHNEADRSAA